MMRLPQGLLLLFIGIILGPDGLGLITTGVLLFVDPAVPVALVALGTLVGLNAMVYGGRERRLLAAATTEAAVTAALVAAAMLSAAPEWAAESALSPGFVALALGACAAPSAAAALRRSEDAHVIADRIRDLDALLPIAIGAAALAWLRTSSVAGAAVLALQACGIALVIVAAAWLLISRASSETEQRVFTAALLLLLGGAADYLSVSALLSGLIAGLFLERAGGPARTAISRDVLQWQRPLVALLLVVTGAHVNLLPTWIGLGLTFLLVRTAAKLIGGWTATRVAGAAVPRDVGARLLSPGVLGVAFALNTYRATGPDGGLVLAVAALGAIGSELLATLVRRSEAAA